MSRSLNCLVWLVVFLIGREVFLLLGGISWSACSSSLEERHRGGRPDRTPPPFTHRLPLKTRTTTPTPTTTTTTTSREHRKMLAGTINGSQSPGSEGVRNIHLGDSPRCSLAGVGRYSKVAVPDEHKMEASRGSSKASSRGNTPSSQGSGASIKQGNGTPPRKSQRAAPRKPARKPPTLFADFPDSTQEATSTFSLIDECIYSTKSIGDSGQDGEVMSCECKTEWGK